jgi:membrane AbrB-like protein
LDPPSKAARVIGGLAAGAAGGAACAWLHVPLPWMTGAIVAMAAAQMSGARLELVPGGRDAGMLVVGVSLGLYFSAPVLREVSAYWPWFVFLGFAAIAYGAASALVLMRLSGVDRATAYFGSMPGGASEMVQMGERHGALPDRVAFAHSCRMLAVVTLVPTAITYAGFSATEDYRPVLLAFDAGGLALLFAAAALAGWVARRVGAPTAFTLGPLLLTIALTAGGVRLSSVPTPLTNVAQVLLGCALGARFDRTFVTVAPRFVRGLLPSVAVMLALAALTGWVISVTSGAYLGTALLSAAPGGIAEMSITAKVLRIGVAFVTAAHVVRYLVVVLFTTLMYRILEAARTRATR